jgi:hypothetical protein
MNHLRTFTIALSLYATVLIYKYDTDELIAILPFEHMSIHELDLTMRARNLSREPRPPRKPPPKCYQKTIEDDLQALIPKDLHECIED